MKGRDIFKLFMGAIVSCGGLTIWASSEPQPYRELDHRQMNGCARGGAPGSCTSNYSYKPCSEREGICWKKDGTDNTACDKVGACSGCDKAAVSEGCSSDRPWNSLCISSVQPEDDPTGCGKFYQFSLCEWNILDQTCRCDSDTSGNDDCNRWIVTQIVGPCIPFP